MASTKVQLTPRGQLHNDTVYGKIRQAVFKEEKVGPSFTKEKIATVAGTIFRRALLKRLEEFGGDPKKAFGGKNAVDKNPVYVDDIHSGIVPFKVITMTYEDMFTKREAVTPDLKIEKVIDGQVKKILEARLAEYGGDAKKHSPILKKILYGLIVIKGYVSRGLLLRARAMRFRFIAREIRMADMC